MAIIKIDASEALVVLVCKSCLDVWRACAWTPAEAYDSAVGHEQRTHPDTFEAREAREQWERRQRRSRPARDTPAIRRS